MSSVREGRLFAPSRREAGRRLFVLRRRGAGGRSFVPPRRAPSAPATPPLRGGETRSSGPFLSYLPPLRGGETRSSGPFLSYLPPLRGGETRSSGPFLSDLPPLRGGETRSTGPFLSGLLSGFAPADALAGVLEEDARGAELFPDGVRAREVPPCPGLLPLGDEPLDLRFKLFRSSLQHVQVVVGVVQKRPHGRLGGASRPAAVHGRVRLADGVVEETYALGEVEVVVEGGPVGRTRLFERGDQVGVVHLRRREPVDPVREVLQPPDLLAGGADRLFVHPKPGPVVGVGDEEEADREGPVACVQEVAEGGDVAQPLRHLGARGVGQVLGVKPMVGELHPVGRLRLGDLVLMVREE